MHEWFWLRCAPEQGTQQGHVGQAVASTTGLVAASLNRSASQRDWRRGCHSREDGAGQDR